MSYHINMLRLKAVARALGEWKEKVVFVGGATVSLYASRPLATNVRPTDDVDVVVELVSTGEFYKLQERLLELGFKHDTLSSIISRFLLQGLKVDFMPTDPTVLGFGNKWYPDGVNTTINHSINNEEAIRIFASPYFIASKLEAFKTRGDGDLYGSHDLEDIVFVLDNRDNIEEELLNAENRVKEYLKTEFATLMANKLFEDALLGHVEQTGQTKRQKRIVAILAKLIAS